MSTFEQVKKIIVEKLGVKPEDVTENATFVNDLGADSLDVVEFVMEVEKEFKITVPDEDAAKLERVGDAVKYIDEHTSGKGGAKVIKMGTSSSSSTSGKMAA
ncbi:MAG: acyl carrier protein [Alphaproteobacteria bacterium]|nr:acyl carrier protein [Alphaproteobacteria bacterium]